MADIFYDYIVRVFSVFPTIAFIYLITLKCSENCQKQHLDYYRK